MTPETTASRFDDPADPAAGFDARLDGLIDEAGSWLSGQRRDDGHWVFELEADATIPAEYILMLHFVGEPDEDLEARIANYLRGKQCVDGGCEVMGKQCSTQVLSVLANCQENCAAGGMKVL